MNRNGKSPAPRFLPVFLAAAALFLTGCPHNEYIVQLEPQADGIERILVFYCADSGDTNTVAPRYEGFDAVQLAAIRNQYPPGNLTNENLRYTAHGRFTGQLPNDVGGAGEYAHYGSQLGEAGLYSERFRGSDDFAGAAERRSEAADQMTGLLLGWSQAELGREPGYPALHQFLDTDVRRDLKNLGAYWWEGQLVDTYNTNAIEDYIVRFGQYLLERGYFETADLPAFANALNGDASPFLLGRVQRLVARAMGVADTNPVPASLAFLADEKTLHASFDQYLTGTELYRARLQQWQQETNSRPDAPKPDSSTLMTELFDKLLPFNLFDTADHLAVRLVLTAPPLHTNGRWDESRRQVVWEADLESRTNATRIPCLCYASWARPDEAFQTQHFGRVALAGDQLMQYCLWRNGLDPQHGSQWDAFVAGLQPDTGLRSKIDGFRFADEPAAAPTNAAVPVSSLSACPRTLLVNALQ